MVISQAAFTLNDTLVKVATGSIGIGQIMLVRGIFATALITVLVWRLGHFQPPESFSARQSSAGSSARSAALFSI